MSEGRKTVDTCFGENQDVSATSAVSAVGSSARNEAFAAKTQTAVTTGSGMNIDRDAVDKHKDSYFDSTER